jgi:hypothetical protein
MPRLTKLRPGPIAVAMAAMDVWRRLTPGQRRQIMAMVRRHGPTVVTKTVELSRRRRRMR